MVDRCEPCQRLARSNVQEDVEISHNKLFNMHPGHTLHVDYFQINNRHFLIMVDRLTGFAKCEMTINNGTDAAITINMVFHIKLLQTEARRLGKILQRNSPN